MNEYGPDCPRCGCGTLARERRPEGYTICTKCGFKRKSASWNMKMWEALTAICGACDGSSDCLECHGKGRTPSAWQSHD